MTIGTSLRFIFQITANFFLSDLIQYLIAISSTLQVIAIILFFFAMWGRIRPVESHIRETKGKKF